ncbi:uncharacterized protein N7473_006321 [Penicillium subrubescens]|uniref:Uncharacterized protein n=1 Tax=Penicillium subrubescens TaxID=1316194 RepID=A0A1Q5UEE4_9EURO|nr:uncharacterized protein N7473_006321 [Penicillium subrubescens]KAJ5896922.1 hypothetical protein N7473_006321 [Penicillium subrubescens]OKP10844.1 hypothetical protein PENSUB_3664 [Penicillium subrubescens]
MFVNIYFEAADSHLTDYALLEVMLLRLENGKASLTLDPEDEEIANCFSFEIAGSCQAWAYAAAIHKVSSWVRRVHKHGLPFDRADVFQVGLGLNIPMSR